ncbi:MAG: cysteine hydrolase family protein [Anaerolineales bacterium]|jgi:nicotinamidase-related amidase
MAKSALIVLDTQVNMFDEEFCVHDPEGILSRIETLISSAKQAKNPVFFVRNNGGEGDPDAPGSPGWEIHPRIKPASDKHVIDKTSPNAFEGTNLQDLLQGLGVEELVIVGMQTEMCVRSTCLAALDKGFEVTLAEDGHTTFDFEDQSAFKSILQLNEELRSKAKIVPVSQIDFSSQGIS